MSFSGVLNKTNAYRVRDMLMSLLVGNSIVIAEALRCDSNNAELRLVAVDCFINSEWTTAPVEEPVRLTSSDSSITLMFSAGGYLWMFDGRPDDGADADDYRYAYFAFDRDRVEIVERAPAGKGALHKRVFAVRDESMAQRVRRLRTTQ